MSKNVTWSDRQHQWSQLTQESRNRLQRNTPFHHIFTLQSFTFLVCMAINAHTKKVYICYNHALPLLNNLNKATCMFNIEIWRQYPPKNLSFKALNFLKDSFFEGAILSENAVHSTTVFDTLLDAMFLANRSRPSNTGKGTDYSSDLVLSVIEIK